MVALRSGWEITPGTNLSVSVAMWSGPGVVLIPMGTTVSELLERCGGMRDGQELIAFAPGGASSNFLPPEQLDVAIDFGTLEAVGSMLGSGAVVFVGESSDLLEAGCNVTRFFRNESCGKCVPCRVGTEKAVKMLELAADVSDDQRQRARRTPRDARTHEHLRSGAGRIGTAALDSEEFSDCK